jgi:phosphate:Na+ symporter
LRFWSRAIAGFSLLFLGLGYMQDSMKAMVQQLDFSLLNRYPLIVFFIAGMVITGIVQASSVTMAITLAALYSNVINIYMAAALVLGAEIGTTFKLALASYKGLAAKKRVAAGNILFNVTTSVLVFIVLRPVIDILYHQFAPGKPLIVIVIFQTFINLVGIILFIPLINYFGNFLDRFFNQETTLGYLKKISPNETDLAIEAMEQEVHTFLSRFNALAANIFSFPLKEVEKTNKHWPDFVGKTPAELYEMQKRHYGELHAFISSWEVKDLSVEDLQRKDQLMNSIRNGMYAAKSMKDAKADIDHLSNSSNDAKYEFYLHLQKHAGEFLQYCNILNSKEVVDSKALYHLFSEVQDNYQKDLKGLYDQAISRQVDALEIATMLNVHREVISAYKSAVFALKDFLLSSKEASLFDTNPGFIR